MKIRNILISSVFMAFGFQLLVSNVAAQEARIIEARTLFFQRSGDASDIYIQAPKNAYKISMPVESFSETFKCVLPNGSAVFYKEEGQNPDGTPKKVVLARTQVPSSFKKVLFYFIPITATEKKKQGNLLYRVIALDDGLKKFPMGHTRLLNLSSTPAAFFIGEHRRKLAAGKFARVPEVKKRDKWNMASIVCKLKTVKGRWRTISEFQARFSKRKRMFIVSYINPKTKQPLLKIYKDIPLEPEP